ncbi:MAG: hypothetical protein J0M08_03965 [Bacteroidetes bacterium]|nr:hypothetical protein [Bacteroidota bacterium]
MAAEVLNSTAVLRLNFGAKLNICASISATSPSRKPLAATLTDDIANTNKLTKTMEYSELDHLKDKEQIVTDIYEKLITDLQKFGQLKIEPKKTSIHLGNRFGFAGVYTRKDYINLEVHLNYKLTSDRVSKVEQASVNRFHHTIKLTNPKDVNKELLTWLKAAYDLKK